MIIIAAQAWRSGWRTTFSGDALLVARPDGGKAGTLARAIIGREGHFAFSPEGGAVRIGRGHS